MSADGFVSIRIAMTQPYDPLDYGNLARSVVDALLGADAMPLPPERFDGLGVYAIYYTGPLDYAETDVSVEKPIYVGSAGPEGQRKGLSQAGLTADRTRRLHGRLRQHARSIEQAENLSVRYARCRYLVVEPVWITLAEQFLIRHFRPLWNVALDGFGNHDPGSGRINMARPRWDIVHPGRPWADILRADETRESILEDLQTG